jgi:hypothetical protein
MVKSKRKSAPTSETEEHKTNKLVKSGNILKDKTQTVKKNDNPKEKENSDKEMQCGICLENIEIQGILNTCKHLFCFTCIEHWSKTSNTCPLCKLRFKQLTKQDLSKPDKKPKKIKVNDADQHVDSETFHLDEDSLFGGSTFSIGSNFNFMFPVQFFFPSLIFPFFDPDSDDDDSEEDSLDSSVEASNEVIDLTIDNFQPIIHQVARNRHINQVTPTFRPQNQVSGNRRSQTRSTNNNRRRSNRTRNRR